MVGVVIIFIIWCGNDFISLGNYVYYGRQLGLGCFVSVLIKKIVFWVRGFQQLEVLRRILEQGRN